MIAYLVTNTVNDKKYIGISQDIQMRWLQHKWAAVHKPKQAFHHAMSKYGADVFTFKEIACASTYPDLLALEQILIKQYDCMIINGRGYNMTSGGEGAIGYRHTPEYFVNRSARVTSEATRERMRDAQLARGWTLSPEHKAKLIASATGRKKTEKELADFLDRTKGRIVSQETLEKMRIASLGRTWTQAQRIKTAATRAKPEWRAAMSALKKGQLLPPDHPFLSHWKGKKHTSETRAKMSASAKAARQRRKAAKESQNERHTNAFT